MTYLNFTQMYVHFYMLLSNNCFIHETMKCKHFDLLYRLFITGGKPNKNWSRLTLGVKSKDRWKNIKEYIKEIVESHQYGEFLYLLQHNWCMPTCRHCGKPLKYNHGYKTYCSVKCARPYQNTSQAASKTWHKNRDAADSQISINKDDLSLYDKKYISLLVKDNALTKYFITVKTSKDPVYANIRYWLSHRISWSTKWSETIYCVCHNIIEQPRCEICSKPVKYISFEKGYRVHCSSKCGTGDKQTKKKISKANRKNGKIRGKKISINKKSRTEEQIKKETYKVFLSKKQNGTIGKSKLEDILGEYITSKFPDMKRQHRTKQYPFACDYYIPSINVYIELQGLWTHGGKPYENTPEDNVLVQKWRDKHTRYYDAAIETWTIRDVKKRNIAKKNNLRYIELFPQQGKPDLTHYKQVIDKIYEEFTRKS